MRFTIGGKEYSVRFQHDQDQLIYGRPTLRGDGGEQRDVIGVGVTTCIIDQVEGKGDQTKVVKTYTSDAKCSLKDIWNRRDGRRVSLSRAFADLAKDINLPKEDRKSFWVTYFARTAKEQYRP